MGREEARLWRLSLNARRGHVLTKFGFFARDARRPRRRGKRRDPTTPDATCGHDACISNGQDTCPLLVLPLPPLSIEKTSPSPASASLTRIPSTSATSRERLAPRFKRALAQIVAIAAQNVEGDKRGLRSAALGQERMEVAPSVHAKHHRRAIDERFSRDDAAGEPKRPVPTQKQPLVRPAGGCASASPATRPRSTLIGGRTSPRLGASGHRQW